MGSYFHEYKLVARALTLQERFKDKRRRVTKNFHDENRANAYEHEHEETAFKVNVFNVTLDTLIREITDRSRTTENVNMFSFLWNPTAGDENFTEVKSQHLSKFYLKDLRVEELAEELHHMNKVKLGANLLGKISSLALLNKIYEKDLQNIFPHICVALRMFAIIPVSVAAGERSFSKLPS